MFENIINEKIRRASKPRTTAKFVKIKVMCSVVRKIF